MFRCDFCENCFDKSEAEPSPKDELGLVCWQCLNDYGEALECERDHCEFIDTQFVDFQNSDHRLFCWMLQEAMDGLKLDPDESGILWNTCIPERDDFEKEIQKLCDYLEEIWRLSHKFTCSCCGGTFDAERDCKPVKHKTHENLCESCARNWLFA